MSGNTTNIKRIDPRRPYRPGPSGLKRIILGDTSATAAIPAAGAAAGEAAKPLRRRGEITAWHMAIVHTNRASLDAPAREAIAAAAILAQPQTGVLAIVLGPLHEDAAGLGADAVAVFAGHDAETLAPERDLALIAALIATYNPAHIFMPDTADATGDLGRRLIARTGTSSATGVAELSAKHVTAHWSGGAALASSGLPRIILLAPGAVDARLPFIGGAEKIAAPTLTTPAEAVRDRGSETLDAASVPLEEADFIVSAGNGVRNTDTLKALARTLGAAVGASRVAVDDGKFARGQQIGATGKTVTATTYMAVGISGAVQHLQGIKDCRHVIAVNRDAGAPIFNRADLSIVGDAEGVMQALLALIAAARNAATSSTEAA